MRLGEHFFQILTGSTWDLFLVVSVALDDMHPVFSQIP